ncbi:MAG: transcriptional repressor [Candidatus Omnitrophica bacterium]|nr:transcriptional repressor [Candidatus Omnitrophota bacterium]MBD3269776.1 transcriptional repressor [Candidatus Omnitrophota bacterium]
MDEIVSTLKGKGIKITPQRLEIYRILAGHNKHLTAESIYERIKAKIPGISLATVYTVLEVLKSKKLISEIRIKFDKSCFESRTDMHHHFLCTKCGRIFDIDIPPCPTLAEKEVNGHLIEKIGGYFYGVCSDCRKKP